MDETETIPEHEMVTALVIDPDGSVKTAEIPNEYEATRDLMGGLIKAVPLVWGGRELSAYVDEEGKIKHLRVNPFATSLTGHYHDPLRGPLVVFGTLDDEGRECSVPPSFVSYVEARATGART